MTAYDAKVNVTEEESLLRQHETEEKTASPGLIGRLFPRGGFGGSAFSFMAASMGAGTLGLPQAFQSAGIAIGIIQLALVGAATIYSMRLLAIAYERTGYHTFEQLSRNLCGRWGWVMEKLTAFLIVVFCWGATVAYVLSISDIFKKLVLGLEWVPDVFRGENGHRLLTVIYWAITIVPLSCMLEINSLRYASLMSTCTSLYLMMTILAHAAMDPLSGDGGRSYGEFNLDMVVAIPTFVFAFCCQTNLFEIYTEMKPRTVAQATKTSGASISVVTVLYVIAGVAGYVNFGNATRGDILNNYGAFASPYITLAFVAICLTLTVSYPLCIYPTRDACVQMLGYPTAYETPTKVRIAVCFILCAASLALGLYVPTINILFGVLGGLCGSAVAFVFPAMYYMLSAPFTPADVGMANFVGTITMLVVGLITGILGTAVSIWQLATGQN